MIFSCTEVSEWMLDKCRRAWTNTPKTGLLSHIWCTRMTLKTNCKVKTVTFYGSLYLIHVICLHFDFCWLRKVICGFLVETTIHWSIQRPVRGGGWFRSCWLRIVFCLSIQNLLFPFPWSLMLGVRDKWLCLCVLTLEKGEGDIWKFVLHQSVGQLSHVCIVLTHEGWQDTWSQMIWRGPASSLNIDSQ